MAQVTARDLEVTAASEIPDKFQRFGAAIWRGFLNPLLATSLVNIARENEALVKFNGCLHFDVISPHLLGFAVTKNMDAAFRAVLGEHDLLNDLDQCILIFANNDLKPTVWHQEAETIPKNTVLCWVNLTPGAGVTNPGLGIVANGMKDMDPAWVHDDGRQMSRKEQALKDNGWPVLYPAFDVGDAVFMTPYTIHKTHLIPGAAKRVSFKVTAIKKGPVEKHHITTANIESLMQRMAFFQKHGVNAYPTDFKPSPEDAALEILRVAVRELRAKANQLVDSKPILKHFSNPPWKAADLHAALVFAQAKGWMTSEGILTAAGVAAAPF